MSFKMSQISIWLLILYCMTFFELLQISKAEILTKCELLVGLQSQSVTDDRWTTFCESVTNADKKIEALQTENEDMRRTITELQNGFDQMMQTTDKVQEQLNQLMSPTETPCGGIVIEESGQISYRSPTISTLNGGSKIRCIWTVRANRKANVTFKLMADQLGQNKVLLTPLTATLKNDGGLTTTLETSDRIEHTVEGPVVFVTLIGNSNSPLSFTLAFQGIGSDETGPAKLYTHYHYIEWTGSVNYPKMRGVDTYSPNEIATFVMNPPRPQSLFKIQLTYIDLENHDNCTYDSLSYFDGDIRMGAYYSRIGPSASSHRYCGDQKSVSIGVGDSNSENFISVFKSDGSAEGTGFKFNWTN